MKQHHPPFMDAEQHTADPALRDLATDFPKPSTKRAAERHTHGPAKLNVLYVLSDDLPVHGIETPEPFTYRLTPRWELIENNWNSLQCRPAFVVPNLIRAAKVEARAAQKLPGEPTRVSLYRTTFPQMTNWPPDEEVARLRFEFRIGTGAVEGSLV
jgi:hypothetical protein